MFPDFPLQHIIQGPPQIYHLPKQHDAKRSCVGLSVCLSSRFTVTMFPLTTHQQASSTPRNCYYRLVRLPSLHVVQSHSKVVSLLPKVTIITRLVCGVSVWYPHGYRGNYSLTTMMRPFVQFRHAVKSTLVGMKRTCSLLAHKKDGWSWGRYHAHQLYQMSCVGVGGCC